MKSRLELFPKTLARELFLRDRQSSLTAADIRIGAHSPDLEHLLLDLASDKTSNAINLLELRDQSIDDLLRLLKPHCSDKSKTPVKTKFTVSNSNGDNEISLSEFDRAVLSVIISE